MTEDQAGRLERVPSRARRLLGGAARNGRNRTNLESTLQRSGPPNQEDQAEIAQALARVGMREASAISGREAGLEADGIAEELVKRARDIMASLEGGAADASISGHDALALEAVIHVRGRPAVRVETDRLESLSVYPGASLWEVLVDEHTTTMMAVAGATAAVAVQDRIAPQLQWVQGTAWLVGANRAVTNRHVLFPPMGGIRLARRFPGTTTARLKTDVDVTLDFAFDNGAARAIRYDVTEVLFVAAEGDPVDVAILKVAPRPGNAKTPKPLVVSTQAFDLASLYVIGHPGRMPSVPSNVQAVFGSPDERKRVSFGEVMADAAAVEGEVVHDASTIGGFSGGCVLGFMSQEARALHYYGDTLTGNRAITAEALRRHPVSAFF